VEKFLTTEEIKYDFYTEVGSKFQRLDMQIPRRRMFATAM
jgi:hypothetical protein